MAKSTIAKKTEGYGYCYTELADINKYCEENGITYYQELETCELNGKDYIITYLVKGDKESKHRGCQIVDAVLQGIKNPVQQYGSSLTYCRRYSLLMALGLATEDDDGASLNESNFNLKEPTIDDAKNYVLTFGKHNGEKLVDVIKNDWYRNYLLNDSNDDYIKKCIELLTGDKATTPQEQDERINLIAKMHELENETDTDHEKILGHFKVESESQLTNANLKEAIKILEKKEERNLLQQAISEN